ncbi:PEP-CTERM sorting domain-containing protein [Scytonema sp. NUACC26]|uniref:PEP-CTERM sorting domain-containing protein n=1 Tax=Scytonema sp. NUACC26 TaxID=3140176 RepID=UPI0038B3F322
MHTIFTLVDTTQKRVLNFFSLVGNFTALKNDDFIAIAQSENVTFIEPESEYNYSFGSNNEFVTASVKGFLNRKNAQNTVLALVEIKRNQARVQVPEPSSILALLASSIVMSLVLKGKRKEKSLESSSQSKVFTEV